MADKLKRIRFLGNEYYFVGVSRSIDSFDYGGSITPLSFVEADGRINFGVMPYAYYDPIRGVIRFGERIGGREDIEVIGDSPDVRLD